MPPPHKESRAGDHAALTGARVALVNMPFAGYRQPSLALGSLASVLRDGGAEVTVIDATLDFAAMVTPEAYDAIAGWPAADLLGERVFSGLTSRPPRTSDDDYAREVLSGGHPAHDIVHFGKPPLTPALCAGVDEARRRAADLLDGCLAELAALRPHVVGFTVMFAQLTASLALAERVRAALPDALVVFGGAGCRGEMGVELRRRFPAVDVVVDGEGEAALPGIVRARLTGEPVALEVDDTCDAARGPVDPRDDETAAPPVDLDALPSPGFGDYFARLARSPLAGSFAPRVPVETSRGCWWGEKRRCTFCGQASAALSYRQKSPGRVLAELERQTRDHPGCPVFLTDEIAPRDAYDTFIPELARRLPGLEIVYFEARPDLSRDDLAALAAAGIRRLEVGVESLSTQVLRLMRKGTTALQGIRLLKWARELGLHVVWNLLWGLPGEDPAEYVRMASLVPMITHLQPPNTVGEVRLDRFSPLADDPASFGLSDVHALPAYGHVLGLPEESLDRIAYFFAFSCARPRPLAEYTRRLAEGVVAWKASAARSHLWSVDDGERLLIEDGRPGCASDDLTVLTGSHRAAYVAAEGVASAEELGRAVSAAEGREVGAAELQALLEPLLDQGLMARDGARFLSLAVRAPRPPA
jgi:ribosomal peptide maturation radical SAM protein 1